MASLMDVLPTLAAIAQATAALPADRPIDGKDITPLLRDPAGARSPHEFLLYYGTRNRLNAIRSGPWKLKFETTLQEETHYGKIPNPDTPIPEKLFHLELDPAEQKSVLKDHADVAKRFRAMANRAREELGDARSGVAGKKVRSVGRTAVSTGQNRP
jgi:arylsulfatase A-like enzyme